MRRLGATSFAKPAKTTTVRAATSSLDSFDGLQGIDLPYDGRQAVLAAMEELGLEATNAEVAARAGLPISEAERLLQWLVLESKGGMRVRFPAPLLNTEARPTWAPSCASMGHVRSFFHRLAERTASSPRKAFIPFSRCCKVLLIHAWQTRKQQHKLVRRQACQSLDCSNMLAGGCR